MTSLSVESSPEALSQIQQDQGNLRHGDTSKVP